MNTRVIIDSLKYLTDNFKCVSSLSTWITQELASIKYNNAKIRRSFHKWDYEVTELLIHLNTFDVDCLLGKGYVGNICYILNIIKDKLKYKHKLLFEHFCKCNDIKAAKLMYYDLSQYYYYYDMSQLLQYVIVSDFDEIASFLLEINPYLCIDDYIVEYAIKSNYYKTLLVIVKHSKRIDINYKNSCFLRCAVRSGSTECVKILIENGAKTNIIRDNPLNYAIHFGYSEIVNLLKENEFNQ